MKLLALGDLHLDWTTHGVDRFPELQRSLGRVLEAAIEERVDAVFVVGDLFNPDSGPRVFRCLELCMGFMRALAEANIEQVWIAGNHDVIEDGSGTTTLTPLKSFADTMPTTTIVFERPGWVRFKDARCVIGLPFVAATAGYKSTPVDELRSMVGCEVDGAIVVGHMTELPGVVLDNESTDLARGRGIPFPLEETRGAACRLNGHFHKAQTVTDPGGGPPIIIPGSLARLTFGESKNEPGFVIVEVP